VKKIERSAWNPPEMVVPHGAFSHVVEVSGVQRWLFLTDKASVAADGSLVGEGDAAAQSQWVLELIGIGLKSGGATWANVVQMSTHLVGRGSVAPFLETRDRFFGEVYPDGDYPANTLVVVDGLVREEMLVAVTAVAALP